MCSIFVIFVYLCFADGLKIESRFAIQKAGDCTELIEVGKKISKASIYLKNAAINIADCERRCLQDDKCSSFSYSSNPNGTTCELSALKEDQIINGTVFVNDLNYQTHIRRKSCEHPAQKGNLRPAYKPLHLNEDETITNPNNNINTKPAFKPLYQYEDNTHYSFDTKLNTDDTIENPTDVYLDYNWNNLYLRSSTIKPNIGNTIIDDNETSDPWYTKFGMAHINYNPNINYEDLKLPTPNDHSIEFTPHVPKRHKNQYRSHWSSYYGGYKPEDNFELAYSQPSSAEETSDYNFTRSNKPEILIEHNYGHINRPSFENNLYEYETSYQKPFLNQFSGYNIIEKPEHLPYYFHKPGYSDTNFESFNYNTKPQLPYYHYKPDHSHIGSSDNIYAKPSSSLHKPKPFYNAQQNNVIHTDIHPFTLDNHEHICPENTEYTYVKPCTSIYKPKPPINPEYSYNPHNKPQHLPFYFETPNPTHSGHTYTNPVKPVYSVKPDVNDNYYKPGYGLDMERPDPRPEVGYGGHINIFGSIDGGYYGKPSFTQKPYKNACYRRVFAGRRAVRSHVLRAITCERLEDCQRECTDEQRFHCESFNYRLDPSLRGKGLCELLTKPVEQLDIRRDFVEDTEYDFYELDRNSLQPDCTPSWYGKPIPHSGYLSGSDDSYIPGDPWHHKPVKPHRDPSYRPYETPYYRPGYDHAKPGYDYKPGHDYPKPSYDNKPSYYLPKPGYDVSPGYHHPKPGYNYGNLPVKPGYSASGSGHNKAYSDNEYKPLPTNLVYGHRGYGYYRDLKGHNEHGYGGYHDKEDWSKYGGSYGRDHNGYAGRSSEHYHNTGHPGSQTPYQENRGVSLDDVANQNFDYSSLGNRNYDSYNYGRSYKGKIEKWSNQAGMEYSESNYYGHHDGKEPPAILSSHEVLPPDTYEHSHIRHEEMSIAHTAIKKIVKVESVTECESCCLEETEFKCVSYSFRYSKEQHEPNCFLSDTPYHGLGLSHQGGSRVYSMEHGGCEHDGGHDVIQSHSLESECFWHVRSGHRLRREAAHVALRVIGLGACEAECLRAASFICKAFSYRFDSPRIGEIAENCILTSADAVSLVQGSGLEVSPGHEVYARGVQGKVCAPTLHDVSEDEYMGGCYLQYDNAAKLLASAVRGTAHTQDEITCASACEDAPFECLSFSYSSSIILGADNCLMSDIRLWDLKKDVDYTHEPNHWLFSFDLYNKKCLKKIVHSFHPTTLQPPPPYPPASASHPEYGPPSPVSPPYGVPEEPRHIPAAPGNSYGDNESHSGSSTVYVQPDSNPRNSYYHNVDDTGPKSYYDEHGNPLPGYSRVPAEYRGHAPRYEGPHVDYVVSPEKWHPITSHGDEPDRDHVTPSDFGYSRYWPVAYLHKETPPNTTYYDFKPSQPAPTVEKPLPYVPLIKVTTTEATVTTHKTEKKLEDIARVNTSVLPNITREGKSDDKVIQDIKKNENTTDKVLNTTAKIEGKLDLSEPFEILDIEDAFDNDTTILDDDSDLKSFDAEEERQIEEIGTILGNNRDGRLNIGKRSQTLLPKYVQISRDFANEYYKSALEPDLKVERRGIVQKVPKNLVQGYNITSRKNPDIKMTMHDGKVFYDASAEVGETNDVKSTTEVTTTHKANNTSKVLRKYDPIEARRRLLEREKLKRNK